MRTRLRLASLLPLLMVGLATALLLVSACAVHDPGKEYRDRTATMSGPELLRERLALTNEIKSLEVPDAAASASADASQADARTRRLEQVQLMLHHVNTLLAENDFTVSEMRYKVSRPDSIAAPAPAPAPEALPAPEPEASPLPAPAAAPEPPREPTPWEAQGSESATAMPAASGSPITSITWAAADGGLKVRIAAPGAAAPDCRMFAMDNPPRIIVDILGQTSPAPALTKTQKVTVPFASAIRVGWHPEGAFVRVVVDLTHGGLRRSLSTAPGKAVLSLRP